MLMEKGKIAYIIFPYKYHNFWQQSIFSSIYENKILLKTNYRKLTNT